MAFDTMEIERHLLKLISTNKMLARMHIHSLKQEWFGGLRATVRDIVVELFKQTPTHITTQLFEAEVHKRFPDTEGQEAERTRLMTEWTLVQNAVVEEAPEALIEKLKEKARVDAITSICRRTLDAVKGGKLSDAAAIIKQEAVMLDTELGVDKPMVDLTDIEDMERRILNKRADPHKYKGIKTGFKKFDERTGGLFPAEMTLVSAVTGIGKSTVLKQVGFNVCRGEMHNTDPTKRFPGRNVLHITNEEHRDQVQEKYAALTVGLDYFSIKNATLTDDDLKHWKAVMADMRGDGWGRVFIKEIPQFGTVSDIYRIFYELEQRGFKIGLVVLDYLDHMAPLTKAWSENDEQAKTAWDFKAMTIDLHVPGITATQAATIVDSRQEKGQHFGKMNVYGSKRRVHASNTVIGVLLTGVDESQIAARGEPEACDKFLTAEVIKNRDGAPFSFTMRHEVKTGRLKEEIPPATSETSKKAEEEKKKAAAERMAALAGTAQKASINASEQSGGAKQPSEQPNAPASPISAPEGSVEAIKPLTVLDRIRMAREGKK